MAISDTKKDLLLGQSVGITIKTIDDNFNTVFDNEADLEDQISAKEPVIATKGTAFNKSFSTTNPVMDGTASVGSADTVARGDHKHPTDTSRLAVMPDGSTPLLDSNNKVSLSYLPDSIVGQLEYMGTFDASVGYPSMNVNKGMYFICSTGGSKNPDGTSASSGYLVGDWAVYNGTKWDKIDNTDAVTMINGQIGSVKTYKSVWVSGVVYYSGDIVLYTDGCLYLYINTSPASGHAPTDTTYWKIFGKVYAVATSSADGLMSKEDKAKLDSIDGAGKVQDVRVNGTSVLDTTTGVASITLQALKAGFVGVTSSNSAWVDYTLNGTTYKAIRVDKTNTTIGVFNSDNQQIVVQEAFDDNYLYLCVGTKAINCTLRLFSGNSVVNGGGSGTTTTTILTVAGWTNKSQTVSVEGVTADSVVFVSPNGNPTNYASSGIYCSAQGDRTLTFVCETVPTTDIEVNVLIDGSGSGNEKVGLDNLDQTVIDKIDSKIPKKTTTTNANALVGFDSTNNVQYFNIGDGLSVEGNTLKGAKFSLSGTTLTITN